MTTTIGIGAAAGALGTTERTLRYYEHRGLLCPTRSGDTGHRRYSTEVLRRARHVLALRDLGLSVGDIRTVLDGDRSRTATVLRAQADRVDAELTRLAALRHRVESRLADLARTVDPTPSPDTLELLEDLAMNLNQIYTRDGDNGTSSLSPGSRAPKTDPRFEVMGDVDELVTAIGMAIAAPGAADVAPLRRIQNDLFDVGADLTVAGRTDHAPAWTVTATYVTRVEQACDRARTRVPPAESFVLPGQSPFTAALHHARAICRRAERHSWTLTDTNDDLRRYLNRLSDLLFLLARANEPTREPVWQPRAGEPR